MTKLPKLSPPASSVWLPRTLRACRHLTAAHTHKNAPRPKCQGLTTDPPPQSRPARPCWRPPSTGFSGTQKRQEQPHRQRVQRRAGEPREEPSPPGLKLGPRPSPGSLRIRVPAKLGTLPTHTWDPRREGKVPLLLILPPVNTWRTAALTPAQEKDST